MASFDERAKDWDSDPAKVERAGVVANAIRAILPHKNGLTGLEVGCGTGLLSFALQPDFSSITLADTSDGMLSVLAGKIKAAGIQNMYPLNIDLASAPLPNLRFDVVYSLMTLHHIPDTGLILQQFFKILNPTGSLCIVDLEKEDGSFHGPAVTDVHKGFDRQVLQRKLETAGFIEVNFSSVYAVKKLISGMETAFPLFLAVAKKG